MKRAARRPGIAPVALAAALAAGCALLERGPAPVLDGSLDVAEYGRVAPGLNRATARAAYWFGVRNDTHSVVNVYLDLGDELHVLHASGSLGRAIYRRDGSKDGEGWQLVEAFSWTARDPAIRQDGGGRAAADAEREALLAVARWTGATFRMGREFETELVVRRDYPGLGKARVAASWLSGAGAAERAATWPPGAEVSEAALALTRGETPARVVFDVARWRALAK